MKSRGFTLLELLLVLALMLILGGTSGIFYARFLNQNTVVTTADQLINQLRKAQVYSMEGKQNTTWGVKTQSAQVILFATGTNAFDESFTVPSGTNITGLAQITFSKPRGEPDSTPTITIASTGTTDAVTINSVGMISRN